LEIVLSTEQDIHKAIEKRYGIAAETVQGILTKKDQESVKSFQAQEVIENIQENDESASVIKLINQILLEADERGATDIHFEPYRGSIRLRYRLDGILKLVETPPSIASLFPSMISRIKVLSGLNLVERRAPQDGRASIKVGDRRIDLRVSIIPTLTGESVVIRILPSQMLLDLQQLGFRNEGLAYLDEMIQKPYGLIFVTGPTGSGKSTTLYACIKRINREDRKIITVEDPVEYEVEGITQIQTNPKVGLTFAAGLRSMLRHDPDVMMVGEVRDAETAELAIRIALTGHLVFSTLHTNDAATGISRLIDIGIDPFLVASAARCFVAQRLVRLICKQCKKLDTTDHPHVDTCYRGAGCEACQQTGFKGRTAIYEILKVTPEIRKMILQRVSSDAIRDKAIEQGMKLLYEDGLDKVREGLITIEEVIRVTTKDE
jgi:type IV pilus assembly protein PilB